MKIGIIGNGFVGKATSILSCKDVELIVYDIIPESCKPLGTTLDDIVKTDIVFISVPTPMNSDGSCHLNILESVVKDIRETQKRLAIEDSDMPSIVNRCTVPVGTSDRLRVNFMPEFLTEKRFEEDFINNPDWIFGLNEIDQSLNNSFKYRISKLINFAHENQKIKSNNVVFVNNKEAELIKLFKNCFLATKVAFCNEIYQFSEIHNINYEKVRELSTRDKRIGPSHTMVPGPDGTKGFGGTCFPKDTRSMLHQIESSGMKSYVLKGAIERNEIIDRPQKDWQKNKGRSVID